MRHAHSASVQKPNQNKYEIKNILYVLHQSSSNRLQETEKFIERGNRDETLQTYQECRPIKNELTQGLTCS